MFLDRIDEGDLDGRSDATRPLIVIKNSPRKAVFKKLNRHGEARPGAKRIKRRSGIMRGNSFAGSVSSQRVVVKINPVKNKTKGIGSGAGSGGQNLYHHIHYISRNRAGEDGEKAVLFDRENEGVERQEFFERCRDDRHHFRMIISPERGSDIEDFRGYVRDVMARVEKDLGMRLDWVGAVHYDTDDVHAHVIIRGKNERGEDLVIGRDYIAFGIRARAQEIATELLGERSIEEIQKSLEKEVDALRVTSLDRFIETQAGDDQVIDVRRDNNFGKSAHYESVLKGRLRYLASSGMAVEQPPGVYALKEGYRDVLTSIATRNDVLKKLYSRIEGLDDLNIYSLKAGEGQVIEGRVLDKGLADELSDKKYIVVEVLSGGKHYVPVGEAFHYDEINKGGLVRVRPFDHSSGKADYNIARIAGQNEGIYDIERHRAYIEKEQSYIEEEAREGYLASHMKRLETLAQNDAATEVGQGRYAIPDDVIERGKNISAKINARERKRFYPKLDILSSHAPEDMVGAARKTWLDRELYKRGKGQGSIVDQSLETALQKRQKWLVDQKLAMIQSNGEFAMRKSAMHDLSVLEVHEKGKYLANKAGLSFNDRKVSEHVPYGYLGYTELETGKWAACMRGQELQMARIKGAPEIEKKQTVHFKEIEPGTFEIRAAEHQKQRDQQERFRGRDDDDNEREL